MVFDKAPQGFSRVLGDSTQFSRFLKASVEFQYGSFRGSREGTRRFHRGSIRFFSVGSHRVLTGIFQVQEDPRRL